MFLRRLNAWVTIITILVAAATAAAILDMVAAMATMVARTIPATAMTMTVRLTNASMTPIKEAGIKDIAGFAKYAAISSKAVAKNSVVAIGVGAMDVYDDFTNPNYTTSEKFTAAGIDAAGVAFAVGSSVLTGAAISFFGLTGAPAIAIAAGSAIVFGIGIDALTSHEKKTVLEND